MKIQPGVGYTFDSSSRGFTIDTSDPFPTVVSKLPEVPLTPTINGDKVTITPGTVNRYIPKIGSEYIDRTPAPTLTVTGTGYVLVKCTYEANKFFPRTAVIIFEAGATLPADTGEESYYPLAYAQSIPESSPAAYSLTNLVGLTGNLVVNRLKAGSNTATWWWSPA